MSVDHLKKHHIEQETQAERQLQQVGKNCEEELPIYGAHLITFHRSTWLAYRYRSQLCKIPHPAQPPSKLF